MRYILKYLVQALTLALGTVASAQERAITVENIVKAVEERHNAVELAHKTAFEMMNSYHQQVMQETKTFFIQTSYEDVSLSVFQDAEFPSLDPNFDRIRDAEFPGVIPPRNFPYNIPKPDPEDSEETRQQMAEEAEMNRLDAEALKASFEELWNEKIEMLEAAWFARHWDEIEVDYTVVIDPVSMHREYWRWWAGNRKMLIETGSPAPPFNPSYSTINVQIGNITPEQLAKVRDKERADYEFQHERLEALKHSVEAGQVVGVSDPEDVVALNAEWEQYLDEVEAWEERHAEEVEEAMQLDYETAPGILKKFLNSSRNKSREKKADYLESLLRSEGAGGVAAAGGSFLPCGAVYSPARIQWSATPGDFESNIKILNQVCRELERILPYYLKMSKSSAKFGSFNRIEADGRSDFVDPIGFVNHENYLQQMRRIAERINQMDHILWPMMTRRDYASTVAKGGSLDFGFSNCAFNAGAFVSVGFGAGGRVHLGSAEIPGEDGEFEVLPSAAIDFSTFGTEQNLRGSYFLQERRMGSGVIPLLDSTGEEGWCTVFNTAFSSESNNVKSRDYYYDVKRKAGEVFIDVVRRVSGPGDGVFPNVDGRLNGSYSVLDDKIAYSFPALPWLPKGLEEPVISSIVGYEGRLVCRPSFSVQFDLDNGIDTPIEPQVAVISQNKSCQVVFPLRNESSGGARLCLNLSDGVGAPGFIGEPFWNLISLEGDLSGLEIIGTLPGLVVERVLVNDENGYIPSVDSSMFHNRDSLPVGRIVCGNHVVQIEWLGVYRMRVRYFSGDRKEVGNFEVEIPNVPRGDLYRGVGSNGQFPESHRLVMLKRDDRVVGILRFSPKSLPNAGDSEGGWSFEDVSDHSTRSVFFGERDLDETVQIDGEVRRFDYTWTAEGGRKGAFAKFHGSTFFSEVNESGRNSQIEPHPTERISVFGFSNQASFGGSWPPLFSAEPSLRIPSSVTYSGEGWVLDGASLEFDSKGAFVGGTGSALGLDGEHSSELNGNVLSQSYALGGSLLNSTTTTFFDGGFRVSQEVNGLTTTLSYYRGNEANSLPLALKSVESPSGSTIFSYMKEGGESEGVSVKVVYTPSGGGDPVESTSSYTGLGSLVSAVEKVGGATVASVVASGHSQGFLGRPTDFKIDGGGLTRTFNRKFDTKGQLQQLDYGDGRVDIFKRDAFGRVAGGSSFDGVSFSPSYGGLDFSANFGGKTLSMSQNIEGELLSQTSTVGSGISFERVGDSDDFSTVIPGQDGRGNMTSFLPDGALDSIGAGLDSPGIDVDYGVEEAGGYNCITVKTTVLGAGGAATPVWEKRFTNGYGQLMRVRRPHPSGQGVVDTDYTYDVAGGTVTIQPPAPSRPIVVTIAPDGSSWSVNKHGQTYSYTAETAGATVTEELTKGGVTLSKTVSNLATGETKHFEGSQATPAATISVSSEGTSTRVQIAGRHGDSLNSLYGKDGIQSLAGSVGGESFGLSVTKRDKFGALLEASIDPAGATGVHTLKVDDAGRPLSLKGPSVDLSFQTSYPGGGVKVEGTDARSGDSFLTRSDATGHPRELRQPDKAPLTIGGEVWSGETTVSVIGLPNQNVTFTHGPTGALLSKQRNDGSGESIEYHEDGSIDTLTRSDGGGVNYAFTFTRDAATGLPTGFNGTDSSLIIDPNGEGDPDSITYNSITLGGQAVSHTVNFLDYFDGQPTDEVHGGVLSGFAVTRDFDPATGELASVALYNGAQKVHEITYIPDGSGRIGQATAPGVAAIYGYGALATSVTVGAATTTRTLAGDGTGRISTVATRAGPRHYSAGLFFNSDGSIRQQTLSARGRGDQRWTYTYEDGQLQRARSNEGQDLDYDHDGIGNRSDLNANPANQYAVYRSMTGSGFTVAGSVAPGAEVYVRVGPPLPGPTLGGVPVPVNGDGSFRAHFSHPATADPASVPVKVVAVLPGAGTDGRDAVAREDRVVVLPPGEGVSTYGPHGALAGDPRWTYHWNAEGRLIGMETRDTTVNAGVANVRLSFAYDAEGRRIWKKAEHLTADGTSSTRTVVTKFVYDGWLLLGEFWTDTVNGAGARYYTRGNDLSGSREGAGGVGGLLAITEAGGGTYTPAYDVAGSIVALVDVATGAEVAYWKRGPFGELIESGGAVEKCPMGFATHYTDEESGLVYFGHRFYSPATGRWLSREPLGEMESFNLYAYCHNDPVGKVDYLGLDEIELRMGLDESGNLIAQVLYIDEFLNGPNYNDGVVVGTMLSNGWVDLGNGRFSTIAGIKKEAGSIGTNFKKFITNTKRTVPERWISEGVRSGEGDFMGVLALDGADGLSAATFDEVRNSLDAAAGFAEMGMFQYTPLGVIPVLNGGRGIGTVAGASRLAYHGRSISMIDNLQVGGNLIRSGENLLHKSTFFRLLLSKGSNLENKAQAYFAAKGHRIVQSQYRQGTANRGFDFLTIVGEGRNARLWINEVKNVTGAVPGKSFSVFGQGASGLGSYEKALSQARLAIQQADLGAATTRTLLRQLDEGTAQIRLIGNESLGTRFRAGTLWNITDDTALQIGDVLNLTDDVLREVLAP